MNKLLLIAGTCLVFAAPVLAHAQGVHIEPAAPLPGPVAAPPDFPVSPRTREAIVRHTLRLLENPMRGAVLLTLEVSTGRTWQELIAEWMFGRAETPAPGGPRPPLATATAPSLSEK